MLIGQRNRIVIILLEQCCVRYLKLIKWVNKNTIHFSVKSTLQSHTYPRNHVWSRVEIFKCSAQIAYIIQQMKLKTMNASGKATRDILSILDSLPSCEKWAFTLPSRPSPCNENVCGNKDSMGKVCQLFSFYGRLLEIPIANL